MSNTPRTDEKTGFIGRDGEFRESCQLGGIGNVVEASFARELERELAKANAELLMLKQPKLYDGVLRSTYIPPNFWEVT